MMKMRRIVTLFAVLSIAAVVLADEPPVPLDKQQQEERTQTENEVRAMRNLGTIAVTDVVRFKLENDQISLDSPQKPTDGDVTCQFREVPGIAIFNLTKSPSPLAVNGFSSLKLIHRNFSQHDVAVVQTSVFAAPRSLQIARDTESPTGEMSISLVQGPVDGTEGTLRLYVQGHTMATGQKTVDLKLAANGLPQLRRKYPREVAAYLLPVFRDLRADKTLYQGDPRAAWQILSEAYSPPPELSAKVAKLIQQLDADSVIQRRQASLTLDELGEPAAILVMRMDRSRLSPEQNAALDTFLAPFSPLSRSEVSRLGSDPDFLLDCLAGDEPALRGPALARLNKVLNHPVQFDPTADEPARLQAIAKIRAALPPPTTQSSQSGE